MRIERERKRMRNEMKKKKNEDRAQGGWLFKEEEGRERKSDDDGENDEKWKGNESSLSPLILVASLSFFSVDPFSPLIRNSY